MREQRLKKGLSLNKLGEAAGCTEAFVSMIENGLRRPSVDLAKRIAKVLGIKWTRFFED